MLERKYLAVILLIVLAFLLGLFISRIIPTGKVTQGSDYFLTRAICNSGKCIDVEIVCRDGNAVSKKPVSDFQEFENLPQNLSGSLCV